MSIFNGRIQWYISMIFLSYIQYYILSCYFYPIISILHVTFILTSILHLILLSCIKCYFFPVSNVTSILHSMLLLSCIQCYYYFPVFNVTSILHSIQCKYALNIVAGTMAHTKATLWSGQRELEIYVRHVNS